MAINKVIYGGNTLLDLTADTASPDKVLSGATYHGNDGVQATGTCTYDSDTSDANLQVAEALEGKTYYGNGAKKTGTMKNNGAVSGAISTVDGTYTIPIGYHDGSGSVGIDADEQEKVIPGNIKSGVTMLGVEGTYSGEAIKAQSKAVTPTKTAQTVQPDEGYDYLSGVTVAAIPYVESANAYGTTVTIG